MIAKSVKSICAGLMLLGVSFGSTASIIKLEEGIAFQDEGQFLEFDDTAALLDMDGVWSPTNWLSFNNTTIDYYATGTSGSFYDAASLTFDLSGVGFENISTVNLQFYARLGGYSDTRWHHYLVQQGAFNSGYEDNSPGAFASSVPGFPEGWYSVAINTDWLTSNDFSLTLRLWNVELDTVQLEVSEVSAPGTIGLFGLGLLALALRTRKAK